VFRAVFSKEFLEQNFEPILAHGLVCLAVCARPLMESLSARPVGQVNISHQVAARQCISSWLIRTVAL